MPRRQYPGAVADRGKAKRKMKELEAKLERKRMKAETKRVKEEAKLVKKYGEAAASRLTDRGGAKRRSKAVGYAETVRGVLYVVLGITVIVALFLGQKEVITSFDDLVDSLFWATAGKIVLGALALAFVIYGLKYLRIVR